MPLEDSLGSLKELQDEGKVRHIGISNVSGEELAWLLARSPVMLPIPGTGSIEHLEENMDAESIELRPDEVERLEEAA